MPEQACPHLGCRHRCGYARGPRGVRVVCPTHGLVGWVSGKRLNGTYEDSKVGGTEPGDDDL